MRYTKLLLLCISGVCLIGLPHAEAKKGGIPGGFSFGHGGGNGGGWKNLSSGHDVDPAGFAGPGALPGRGIPAATPGVPAPQSNGLGAFNAPFATPAPGRGGEPPLAPDFRHGRGHAGVGTGSVRAQEQHQLNAFHPEGKTRAADEHFLDTANRALKGKGHGHGPKIK